MENFKDRINNRDTLAWLEDRINNTSAYLARYDSEFLITFSIHNENDFDNEWDNVSAFTIDLNDHNTVDKIKEFMIKELKEFSRLIKEKGVSI